MVNKLLPNLYLRASIVKEYGQILEPGIKLMGYSTFRHFMKEQFPHVKFCKIEPKSNQIQQNTATPVTVQNEQPAQHIEVAPEKCIISNSEVIPLVVTQNNHQQTIIVTPVQQIINGGIVQGSQTSQNATYSYQLSNASYVINEQGNLVTTITNSPTSQYTFNRIQ